MKYRVVIWGMGVAYNRYANLLKYYEIQNEIEVVAITSNHIPRAHFLDGYTIIPPEELNSVDYSYLIIMSDKYFGDIRKYVLNMGVQPEKILNYKILDIPYFDFHKYVCLKESRISIISNNCWGGVIYNTLGMECLSPFKNLFLNDGSYICMLKNLDYYLGCEPEFGGYGTDVHTGKEYPIIQLDDVSIHCNHDNAYEAAVLNWNRRVKKINRNNLFVEMYTSDRKIMREFSRLREFDKKICFVPFQCNESGCCYLQSTSEQAEFWETVLDSARYGARSMSYHLIDMLNGEVRWRYD